MRPYNPCAIVSIRLALHTHYLKWRARVKMDSSACRNSRNLFHISAKEGITRAHIRCKANMVSMITTKRFRLVQEPEFPVPNPFIFTEERLIFTLQDLDQKWEIYDFGWDWIYFTQNITCILIAVVLTEKVRVRKEILCLSYCPLDEIIVTEDHIFTKQWNCDS